jgi:IS5 family transposase
MKSQKSPANAMTFEKYKKPTRREQFLAEMEQVFPWKELCALIELYYPKPGMFFARPNSQAKGAIQPSKRP